MSAEIETPESDKPLDLALCYARRGWRVAPVAPGGDHPCLKGWPEHATSDPEHVIRWWQRNPTYGIAVITGEESDLFVLDVDVGLRKDGSPKEGMDSLRDLEAQHGKLPDTYTVVTPSGGEHYYFSHPHPDQIPGGYTLGSSASIVGIDLDIRSTGGLVLAPPCQRKGGKYHRELSSPNELAAPPDWLVRLACTAPVAQYERPPGPARSDRPGDQWAAATPWSKILEPLGFSLVRADGACQYWGVPGASNPVGASTNNGGRDTLHMFSSSCSWLEANSDVRKFHVLTVTDFDGDHSAAAKWCASQGYGESSDRSLTSVMAPPAAAPASAMSSTTDGGSLLATLDPAPDGGAEGPVPWPAPVPLGGIAKLPEFPRGVFPEWIEEMIDEVARELQQARDIAAMAVLGSLTAVTSGRVAVNVDGRQIEETNLYLVTAAPPSEGKSPAHKAMWKPVLDAHAQRVRDDAPTIANNAAHLQHAQKKGEFKG